MSTPTPWNLYQHPDSPYKDRWDIVGKTRDDGVLEDVLEEDARLIVKAVNNHHAYEQRIAELESCLYDWCALYAESDRTLDEHEVYKESQQALKG